jgi:TM2 domain-containing membrane protein YozV
MDYYIYKNDQNIGPLSEVEVVNGLRSGRYMSNDLGCRVGESEWRDLSFLLPLQVSAPLVSPPQPVYQRMQHPIYQQSQPIIHQTHTLYQPAPNNFGNSSEVSKMLMYQANQKSATTAFLLWFFLGFWGAHRFYCGKTGTGIVYVSIALVTLFLALITFFISGAGALLTAWILWIWQIVDVFLISGWIKQHNNNIAKGVNSFR